MKQKIFVITVMLNGRRRFVMLGDRRDDQKFIMEYTDKPEHATDFGSKVTAAETVLWIHNPYERELTVGTASIDVKPSVPIFSGSFK